MNPRILVVANRLADGQYSMLGFADWLMQRMPAEGFAISRVQPTSKLKGKWPAYLEKYVLFPRDLRRAAREADLVHIADHSNAMYGAHLRGKWGITVHDLLPIRAARGEFPDWTIGPTGQKLQNWILDSLKRVPSAACVSGATRDDLLRLTALGPEQATLIHNGLYRPMQRHADPWPVLRAAGLGALEGKPFVLHIGGNQPYKNRGGYVRIASLLGKLPGFEDLHVVAAGKPLPDGLRAEGLLLGDRFHAPTNLPNEVVTALYSTASALVFPSFNEGFGLPVIEAMACGCPVFTSNRAPMTEAGGDAARYFDPEAPEKAAQAIADHWSEREAMAEAGLAQSGKFTSEAMAAGYAAWYRSLL